VHLRQSGGLGRAAGQARLGLRADAGLRDARRRRGLEGIAARHRRLAGGQAAAAAGVAADVVAAGRALRRELLRGISRLLQGRTDDIINVAGHRLSTGGMEEVLASHADVAECAVLGIKDELKGEVPCGFIVLKAGVDRPPAEIEKEIVALVRDKIGPVAAFKLAITVARLPKTRSGKILRGTIKKIADKEPWTMPATIEDPKVLEEIGEAVKERGVGG
jgi:hypothetical protein